MFDDYLNNSGHKDVLNEINNTEGANMVVKALNYAKTHDDIEIVTTGFEAQTSANKGEDIGVIGVYTKDGKTIPPHYSMVAPSTMTYDESGVRKSFKIFHTKKQVTTDETKDPNSTTQLTGPLLGQVGAVNGFVAFGWAYNRVSENTIQTDKTGAITGGIIYIQNS